MDRVWFRRSICSLGQKRAAIETYIRLDYCGADTIAEFAYGCSHLEAALDIELGRPCLLFRSAHVILQTSLFGADFRYYPPPTCNCEAINTARTMPVHEALLLPGVFPRRFRKVANPGPRDVFQNSDVVDCSDVDF